VTDSGLIALCRERGIDYSACTSVTAVMCGDLLSIAHLGDSKIVLGRYADGSSGGAAAGSAGSPPLVGKYLTTDHKPDMPHERRRIEEVSGARACERGAPCRRDRQAAKTLSIVSSSLVLRTRPHPPPHPQSGGSLAYLHGGKPFIRGGDFTARQALGDRPMQLNYSRAFGGKDLKMYGLSWVPDILHIRVTSADKCVPPLRGAVAGAVEWEKPVSALPPSCRSPLRRLAHPPYWVHHHHHHPPPQGDRGGVGRLVGRRRRRHGGATGVGELHRREGRRHGAYKRWNAAAASVDDTAKGVFTHPSPHRPLPPATATAQDMVDWALEQHDIRGTIDNVTVAVAVIR
jgi:hypothetical protein